LYAVRQFLGAGGEEKDEFDNAMAGYQAVLGIEPTR